MIKRHGCMVGMLALAATVLAGNDPGFLDSSPLRKDSIDASPVLIRPAGSLHKDVALIDFGSRPIGRVVPTPGLRLEKQSRRGAPIVIDLLPAEPRFRKFHRDSIEELTSYVRLIPSDSHARTVLAVRLFQTNQFAMAAEQIAEAHRLDRSDRRIGELYSGIIMQGHAGDLPGNVVGDIQRIMDALPDNEVVRFNLACALARSGRLEESMHQLDVLQKAFWPELVHHMNDRDLQSLYALPRYMEWQNELVADYRERLIESLQGMTPNLNL